MNFRKYTIFFLPFLLISGGCYKNEPVPSADFSYAGNNEFAAPCMVQFSNQSMQAYSYSWWFGSDSSVFNSEAPGSTLQNPSHLYQKAGTFSVTLRAYTSSRKEWASVIKTITIKDSVR
jgi:PKD repeat protein